jgi:hypothetical protein
MSLILKQKAYEINLSKIEEGYLYSELICYSETIGKAKSELLKKYQYEISLKFSEDDVNFLNIPVIRCKLADKFEFEGKYLTKNDIDSLLIEKKRLATLEGILKDDNISHCYIRKGSYYRPNSCGYTDMQHRAGIFTKKEAVSSGKGCRDLKIIPISIGEHNIMINREIDDLKTRLILQ